MRTDRRTQIGPRRGGRGHPEAQRSAQAGVGLTLTAAGRPSTTPSTRPAGAQPPSWTRSSKLTSQPAALVTVTVVHVPLQPVAMVTTCPAPTVAAAGGCPAQARVTVAAAPLPLKARRLTRRRGATKSKAAL